MFTRPPAVAGKFYPESPAKLDFAVRSLLREAVPAARNAPIGLVVPHAGLVFSGQIAADAYNQLIGHHYDLIVLFGTNHTSRRLDSVAIPSYNAFSSPLGEHHIPRDLVNELMASLPAIIEDDHAHRTEHSIEVQLPFLQVTAPDAPILPLIVAFSSSDLCRQFGSELAKQLKNRKVLYIASSDLSHYPTKATANQLDRQVLKAIVVMDDSKLDAVLHQSLKTRDEVLTRACGGSPIHALLGAMNVLGAKTGLELSYANSGDTLFGEDDKVVGYGAVAFYREPKVALPQSDVDTTNLGQSLLNYARRSLKMNLGGDVAPLARNLPKAASERCGAFVSLYNGHRLRGCVGQITSDDPLSLTVGKMALAAASNDMRFSPVDYEEVAHLTIEVSVLSGPKVIERVEEIEPGRDGVIIAKGGKRGVFLPKVAEEQGWNREELLLHLCDKANLTRGAWLKGAELSTFQAEVFKEE